MRPSDHADSGPSTVAWQLLAAQLTMAGGSLVVNLLSARSMGPGGRGELALYLQVSYIAGTLALAGAARGYPATVHRRPAADDAAWTVRRLVTPGALAVLLGCLAVAAVRPTTAGPVAVALAAATLGGVAVSGVRTVTVVAGTGPDLLRLSLLGQVMMLAVAAGLTVRQVAAPAPWLAGYGCCLAVPFGTWLYRRSRRVQAPPPLGRARRLSLQVLPATAATIVFQRADRLLLPALASYRQLGLYIVVATGTELVTWPVQNWVDARVPDWHRRFLTGDLPRARTLAATALYVLVACVLVTGLGRLLLVPLFGRAYSPSLGLLAPLALAAGLYCLSRVCAGLSLAADRPGAVLAVEAAAVTGSVAGYLTLIGPYGATGAALGTLIGALVAALVGLTAAARLRPRRDPATPIDLPTAGTAEVELPR